MGFEELPHTADCALRVWATDLPSLFTDAAMGLNSIAGAVVGVEPRRRRCISLHGSDPEILLVSFLSELIYLQEEAGLAFDEFHLKITSGWLRGTMKGSRLLSLSRVIKAVTFHNLEIRRTARGHEVEIVFDV